VVLVGRRGGDDDGLLSSGDWPPVRALHDQICAKNVRREEEEEERGY